MDRIGPNELSAALPTGASLASAVILACALGGVAWFSSAAAPTTPAASADVGALADPPGGAQDNGPERAAAPPTGPEQIPTVAWHAGPLGPQLQGHSIVFDPVNNLYWLFGGQSPSGLGSIPTVQNTLFRKSATNLNGPWEPVSPTGIPPLARAYHVAAYDLSRTRMLVWGGVDSSGTVYSGSTVYFLDVSNPNSPAWSSQNTAGAPAGRSHSAAVYVTGFDAIVISGGFDTAGDPSGLNHAVNLGSSPVTWTAMGTMNFTQRGGHALVHDILGQRLLTYGGANGLTDPMAIEDIVTLNLSLGLTYDTEWDDLVTTGGQPRAFMVHGFDVARRLLWTEGGLSDTGSVRSDTAALDLNADPPAWTDLNLNTGPRDRTEAGSAWSQGQGRLLVHGGVRAGAVLSDTWTLGQPVTPSPTPQTGTPSPATPTSTGPTPTQTPTLTPTPTGTPTGPTLTPSSTFTASPTVPTPTPSSTFTASPTVPTATPSSTFTASPTVPTATHTSTATGPTPTPSSTLTPSATHTPTSVVPSPTGPSPTASATPTAIPSVTPTRTGTVGPSPTATSTAFASQTAAARTATALIASATPGDQTPGPSPSNTPEVTPTTTSEGTAATPDVTASATRTSVPTATLRPPGPITATVEIDEFEFRPDPIVIRAGDTVEWTNVGLLQHTTSAGIPKSPEMLWDSPLLAPGESFAQTFEEPGRILYYCAVHPELMRGTVIILDPRPRFRMLAPAVFTTG